MFESESAVLYDHLILAPALLDAIKLRTVPMQTAVSPGFVLSTKLLSSPIVIGFVMLCIAVTLGQTNEMSSKPKSLPF